MVNNSEQLPLSQKLIVLYATFCVFVSLGIILTTLFSDAWTIYNLLFNYSDTWVDWHNEASFNFLAVVSAYFVLEFHEFAGTV